MATIDNAVNALSKWLTDIAASALPSVQIPSTSWVGKAMSGFFGIDLSTYNVWRELGFLTEPMMKAMVEPTLRKYLSALPEEQIAPMLRSIADSAIAKAGEQGYVNVFGIQLGANAFEGLKNELERI